MSKKISQCSVFSELQKKNSSQCTVISEELPAAQDEIKEKYENHQKMLAQMKHEHADAVDLIADELVERFRGTGLDAGYMRPFFCKCAWYLPKDEIDTVWKLAHRNGISSPIKYFVFVCNKKLRRLNIG